MSVDSESSWRLLFHLALSHGRALQSQQLAWEGWMVFLSSASLVGTSTGVFPVLLDQLWQRQSLKADAERHGGGGGFTSTSPSASTNEDFFSSASEAVADGESGAASADAMRHADVVGFGGFVDMMKVLCMRVYQTFQFASQRERQGDGADCMLQTLRRCAEDRVLVTEAVHFTASRYFRPFIARSTIHAASQVSLRASRNGWAPHVNRLLTHIVGSFAQPVILPLYRSYANAATGRLDEEGFRRFVRDYLPGLNAVEETCALAIFAHGGFPDVRPLLQAVQGAHVSTPPGASPLAAHPTLGLTDFMEALLMLAVVVSADEARHPNLRAITAKVWAFFERVICHGARASASMCGDPYESGRYVTMPPGLVSVYPSVVALLPLPTLMVEVCNATVVGDSAEAAAASPASAKPPAVSRVSPAAESTPFLTEVSVSDAAGSSSLTSGAAGATGTLANAAIEVAAPFFSSQWSLLERHADVPLFGAGGVPTACHVTVGGTVVEAAPTSCPEMWEVTLGALSLASMKLLKCAVEAAPGSGAAVGAAGEDGSVRLIFTPIRSLPVELVMPEPAAMRLTAAGSVATAGSQPSRDSARSVHPWGCKDVVFTDTTVTQVVPASMVAALHGLMQAAEEQPNSGFTVPDSASPAAASPSASPSLHAASFSHADLCGLCQRLKWCEAEEKDRAAGLSSLCSQALVQYRLFQRTLHSCGPQPGLERGPSPPISTGASSNETAATARLSLLDVLGCLSVLLLRTNAGGLRDIPSVPRRLELALLAASSNAAASTSADKSDKAAHLRSLPHNRLRDEPFKLALERKEVQSAASRERRAALIAAIQAHHAQQVSCVIPLPSLPETRPNAMRLVSQYGNADPVADFQRVMLDGAQAIKDHFIERELAIPEWPGV